MKPKPPRHDYYRRNRPAAYWRAVTIKLLWLSGSSYREIAEHFHISAERARQIVKAPDPAAQLTLPTVYRLLASDNPQNP